MAPQGTHTDPASLDLELKEARESFERVLKEFMEDERATVQSFAPQASVLIDEIERMVLAGGKRMRPALCYLGFRAAGGRQSEKIIRASAAMELFHTFALIHDDVMDGASKRRGVETIHAKFENEREAGGGADAERHGVAVAVLAGDLALVLSDRLFYSSGFPPAVLATAWEQIHRCRVRTAAGQFLDLTEGDPAATARLKTAAYSVEGPLTAGAALAGAKNSLLSDLSAYGEAVGTIFQIADDIRGLWGDPQLTGKDADRDVKMGKVTSAIAAAIRTADQEDRRSILSAWGNPKATDQQIQEFKRAALNTSALAELSGEVERLSRRAAEVLDRSEIRTEVRGVLGAIASSLVDEVFSLSD